MPAPVLHQAVVEVLGQAIADHALAEGQAVLLEDVMGRLNVSRAVARESVRVLETLGMVAVKRRVGNVVQPRSHWQVMDPRVIRWRLAGVHQAEELDQLMQVRTGIEPIAARLAATAAPD
ncbi:MAG: FadR/GntR family transcriptional regulator, partial [Actinomycetes bacterium]